MPKKGKLDKNKEGRWRSLLEIFRTSGKTQTEFCKENDVSAHQFQYWMTEVKKRDAAKAKVADGGNSAFVPVSLHRCQREKLSLRELPSKYSAHPEQS